MANKAVKFYRGLKSSYDSSTHADGIYFATDAHEILLNGVSYGADPKKKVQNVTLNSAANGLVITYTDATSTTLLLGQATATADGLMSKEDKKKLDTLDPNASGSYTSALNSDIATVEKLGGIAAGTTVASLTGKSYNEIFDTLIFPTVNPTFVNPSAGIAFNNGYTSVQEVGDRGPTINSLKGSYNPGQINISGKKQANRGGALKESESKIVYGPEKTTSLPARVIPGPMHYYYRASYEAGPQPKNSKGEPFGSPLAAGTVESDAITVYGYYPAYSGLLSTDTINETIIKSLTKTVSAKKSIKVSGPISEQYICFAAPEGWNVVNIKDSNNFDVTSSYKKSTVVIKGLGDTQTTYTVYLSGKMSQPGTYSVNFN